MSDRRSEVELPLQTNLGKEMHPDALETYDAREGFAELNPVAADS